MARQEKILALKAFYLGRAIAPRPISRNRALQLLEDAIDQLQASNEPTNRIRLAMYYLIRAEITRGDELPIDDRLAAQTLCLDINSALFDYFMAVEQATQSKQRIDTSDMVNLPIVDRGIQLRNTSAWDSSLTQSDLALGALGLTYEDLSEQEGLFLEKATLKELLLEDGVSIGGRS